MVRARGERQDGLRKSSAVFWVAAACSLVTMFSLGCDSQDSAVAKSDAEAMNAAEGPRPNIVFVLVDALRADRLGVYGHPRGLTPTMDAWAREGALYENCVSAASWTLPSVATLFSGYYPTVHGAASYRMAKTEAGEEVAEQAVLADDFVTLAEVMQLGGYETAGIVGVKFLHSKYGFAQGFEHYDCDLPKWPKAQLVNERAMTWLTTERDADRPFFLYLHYMDVHGPYNAAPEFLDPLVAEVEANENKTQLSPRAFHRISPYLRNPPTEASDPERYGRLSQYHEYWIARYEAGVAEMDHYLKRLQTQLEQNGLWDDTLIVLTADHGEALGEFMRWDHGGSLYAMEVHVPLIIRWPGRVSAGQRISQRCGLIDVYATLLSALRLPIPATVQSVPLPLDPATQSTSAVRFADATKGGVDHQNAIFVGDSQLLVRQPAAVLRDSPGATVQMFDLSEYAPSEIPLAPNATELVREMLAYLKQHREESAGLQPAALPAAREVDRESIQALRALGYVGGDESADDPNTPEP